MQLAQHPMLAYGLIGLLFTGACSSTTTLDFTIKETDRGAVYLERSADRALPAAHPIRISPDTMARILRGISIQEESGLLRNLVGGKSEPIRVFKDDELQFLAPLLAEGLTKAASDQEVGFRLGPARASAEVQRGSVYAYGRSLYLTLPWLLFDSRYGAGGRALSRTIVFTPESARRPDSYRRGSDIDPVVIVDYEVLASLPDNPSSEPRATMSPTPVPIPSDQATQGTDTQLRALQEQMRQKNEDLDELRKELQDIRRQLADPSTGSKPSNTKSKPAQDSR